MPSAHRSRLAPTALTLGALTAATAAALALINHRLARRAERHHPPTGTIIAIDGVRLHVTDRGQGPPVLLIHGNAVTASDWDSSGVAGLLLPHHRVIAIDRPGFGHSTRPRDRVWTAAAQADLLHAALETLGVDRPVVVGHSWGAIVALALATRHQASLAGLVLVSGYYVWTLRPDVLPQALAALPVLGDALRYTIAPILGRLNTPLLKRLMFAPRPVPPRFQADYANELAVRPGQLRATAEDAALMIPGVLAFRGELAHLRLPVTILAGAEDRIVWPRRARWLAAQIPHSLCRIVPGAGHMLHHAAPALVRDAVDAMDPQATATASEKIPIAPRA